jgi:two-component system, NarL family, sensor kinase
MQASLLISSRTWRRRDLLAISIVLVIIVVLDFTTPVEYVVGYLYLLPLLMATGRFSRKSILALAVFVMVMLLLNLWWPTQNGLTLSVVTNRLIATIALMITTILSDRNALYATKIANQQSQLQAKNQLEGLREDFAGTLAHDLKTPLLGALSTLNAFLKEEFGSISAIQQQVLSTMQRSHETSLRLLDTLLDIYRNDTQGLQLQLAPIDLTPLVEETANQVAAIARQRQVKIIIRHGDSEFRRSLWVKADPLQLQRVLMNLLVNAINHSRRGDRVDVVLESQRSQQCVKVLDQGAGLHPDELNHLFQRFYQGSSDRQAKGSGLGLYLARQIINAHQGKIWAENRSPRGAIFGFQLPIYLP